MILYDDSKLNNKPLSKNSSKRGTSEQIEALNKKTRRASNTMDTIDLNSCDPLLSSSNLALLCSSLPMDQSSTVATNSKLSNTDIMRHQDIPISMDNSLAPPSPPWEDDDDVTMMMTSQGFKSFCNSSDLNDSLQSDDSNKVSSMVDEFLSYSPDSLRLDSDTDEAINSFLLEAAAAVAHPSSPLSASDMSSIKIENIGDLEEEASNSSSLSLTEGHNSIRLSNDHNDLTTTLTTRRCDDKISINEEQIRSGMLPKLKHNGRTEVPWKKVVVTIDGDNNIIEEEGIDQGEQLEQTSEARHFFVTNTKENYTRSSTKPNIEKPQIAYNEIKDHCISPKKSTQQKLPTQEAYSHCSVCKLVFTSETQLAEHRLAYADRIACCHCCKTFATMSKLRVHHRKHSKEKPFQCLSCGKYYTHRQSLLRHQLLYCPPLKAKCNSNGVSMTSVIESGEVEENVLRETREDVLVKSELRITNTCKESKEHIILSSKISPTDCEGLLASQQHKHVIEKSDYKTTKDLASTNLDCTIPETQPCKRVVGGKRKRVKEIDIVDEEETRCRVCDKEFYDVDSLVNHREYHLTHRTCCLCQKVMGNKSKLLTHHRSHTKELPYTCQVCDKRFAENSTLRKHEATHGERNFRCDVCSKAFVRKDYLAKHMLTHQQTYKCSQCGFVCHNRSDIESHISKAHRG